MTQHLLYTLGAFIFSMVCGFAFIPMILRFCERRKLYDVPNERKIHKNAIPRLGGVSFMPSMLLAVLCTLFIMNGERGYEQITMSIWSLYFIISLAIIYITGIVDDFIGLDAKTKFTLQIIAASLLPIAGLYINNLYGMFGINEIPFWIGAPLTVFLIVLIDNAINLIDGIDGLSAGFSLIVFTGFLTCFLREGLWLYGLLIAGLMGVLVSFLYYNMFSDATKKRKIFMGDSGSLTLGFIMGFLTVKFIMVNPNVMPFHKENLVVAFTLLLVPLFDVARIIIARIRHKRHIFQSDKNHIHHKLMRTGLSQHQALVCILSFVVGFIAINLSVANVLKAEWVFLLDILVWLTINGCINYIIQKKGEKAFV